MDQLLEKELSITKNSHNSELKILMVDDKPENLIALERLLRDLPVKLYKAFNGNEALRLTLHHDFALALLDIQMPEMDGYELAELLRQEEKTADMPFIFISAIYTDSINIFQGYEKGAFSYITKPFEPRVLLAKVKFFIDKHRKEKALEAKTRQLEIMNDELKSFSYSVSHDLRAPLRAISGFSNALRTKAADQLKEEHQRYLNMIVDNVERMNQLINDLLAFSRMSRQEQNFTVVDMQVLVKTVFDELMQSHETNSPKLKISELPEVTADEKMMHQVMTNLIGNAIKYSKGTNQPKIEIGGEIGEDEIIYYIKDNGVGFNTEYYDKMFQLFQRLHTDDEFEGTGVGLAIVKRIIDRHHGRVWAESVISKGSTFYFSMPK
tara:strand:- start:39590 stop:40729 length:1140 start_codon:yes stop_codon:yes gene_type:complete